MSNIRFTAFYPSRPFWAGSTPHLIEQHSLNWLHSLDHANRSLIREQIAEEVFSKPDDQSQIRVARDGRIMVHIAKLEAATTDLPIKEMVGRWNEYLNYLNAFYLLPDSSTNKIMNLGIF